MNEAKKDLPKKANRSSLAYKLTAAWMWKRFVLLLQINVLILCLVAGFLFYFTEQNIAKTYIFWRDNPNSSPTAIYTIEPEIQPKGKVLSNSLKKILPESTATAYRSFDNQINPDTEVRQLKYNVTVFTDPAFTTFSYDFTREINWLKTAFLYLLILEAFLLLDGFFSDLRSTRKTLRPLTDIVLTAQNLNRQPQPGERGFRGHTERIKFAELEGKINSINVEHLDTPLQVNSRELDGLADAINAMLHRINEAYLQQSQFVSDASHELRTPIAVIQGYVNLLDRWGKNDEKALQESIDAIKSESAHMKDLVEQLLFLARSDNDTMLLNLEILDANALLSEVFRETQMIDSGHKLKLIPSDSMLIKADEGLIKQAIRILVDNAIKYTPAGDEISLKLQQEDNCAKIYVQDQGIGIASEDLPHLFDRFFRSEPSRTRASGGTGLGLSIAKWIVEKHDGYFEIVSRPEIGTRFIASIPLADETTPQEQPPNNSSPAPV